MRLLVPARPDARLGDWCARRLVLLRLAAGLGRPPDSQRSEPAVRREHLLSGVRDARLFRRDARSGPRRRAAPLAGRQPPARLQPHAACRVRDKRRRGICAGALSHRKHGRRGARGAGVRVCAVPDAALRPPRVAVRFLDSAGCPGLAQGRRSCRPDGPSQSGGAGGRASPEQHLLRHLPGHLALLHHRPLAHPRAATRRQSNRLEHGAPPGRDGDLLGALPEESRGRGRPQALGGRGVQRASVGLPQRSRGQPALRRNRSVGCQRASPVSWRRGAGALGVGPLVRRLRPPPPDPRRRARLFAGAHAGLQCRTLLAALRLGAALSRAASAGASRYSRPARNRRSRWRRVRACPGPCALAHPQKRRRHRGYRRVRGGVSHVAGTGRGRSAADGLVCDVARHARCRCLRVAGHRAVAPRRHARRALHVSLHGALAAVAERLQRQLSQVVSRAVERNAIVSPYAGAQVPAPPRRDGAGGARTPGQPTALRRGALPAARRSECRAHRREPRMPVHAWPSFGSGGAPPVSP